MTPNSAGRSIVVIVKGDPRIDKLLDALRTQIGGRDEMIVVDASDGLLDEIRQRHPEVDWIQYVQPEVSKITIPHQRNKGIQAAKGEVIVFIDADCLPDDDWLQNLCAPIQNGEEAITAGSVRSLSGFSIHDIQWVEALGRRYLNEAPTQNLAVRARLFQEVGSFDESFSFGSDVDFTWRAVSCGYRIRYIPSAGIRHDWGRPFERAKRAFRYGDARASLFRKHPNQIKRLAGPDFPKAAYALFLLGLPITLRLPVYPILLVIPLLKNRKTAPFEMVATNLISALGFLKGLISLPRPF